MIITDFETRQLLAREHRDQLSAALSAGDRASSVNRAQSYFTKVKKTVPWASPAISPGVDWTPLYQTKKFRKSVKYRRAYEVLKLHPGV